ncbi:MAG: DUF2079 domain-containing protein, partial [Thermoplasmata archaeon]|nr:DUF2079 domain-containing protein [Thermoplasmata archaeon]
MDQREGEGSSRPTSPTVGNDPVDPHRRRLGTIESRWLIVLIATFAVSLTALCDFRFHELYATTWDFGIYQQAIYSTAHGRPFYESADLATGGYGSFLQVHSALTLYAVVPLYAAYPDPITLFAVQSVVVGAAALPLYLLATSVGVSPRRSLGLAGLFLVAAPTVASTMYDFHAEAFVPLVYLTVAWLWQTKRYGWGAVAVGIGFLTMEVVPVLLFFLALFFLSQRVRRPEADGIVARFPGDSIWTRLRALVLDPGARPTWLLLAASFVAYYLLLALRYHWFSDWFGFPPFPSVPRGYVVGATPNELGLSLSNVVIGLYGKATYWIVLLVLVGGLPLWAPRTWILSAPWIAFTFLTADPNYTILGFQYGFIAGAPLFASAAYALPNVRLPWPTAASPAPPGAPARWRRGRLAH